jgi:hypothetical protein
MRSRIRVYPAVKVLMCEPLKTFHLFIDEARKRFFINRVADSYGSYGNTYSFSG